MSQSWNMWPRHPIESTVTNTWSLPTCRWGISYHLRPIEKHLPLDHTLTPKVYKVYPQGIKRTSYFTKDCLRMPVSLSCNTQEFSLLKLLALDFDPTQQARCVLDLSHFLLGGFNSGYLVVSCCLPATNSRTAAVEVAQHTALLWPPLGEL